MNELVSWYLELDFDTNIYYVLLCFMDNHIERVCTHCYSKDNALNFGKRLIDLYKEEKLIKYI